MTIEVDISNGRVSLTRTLPRARLEAIRAKNRARWLAKRAAERGKRHLWVVDQARTGRANDHSHHRP
jgi:hypothetical protein